MLNAPAIDNPQPLETIRIGMPQQYLAELKPVLGLASSIQNKRDVARLGQDQWSHFALRLRPGGRSTRPHVMVFPQSPAELVSMLRNRRIDAIMDEVTPVDDNIRAIGEFRALTAEQIERVMRVSTRNIDADQLRRAESFLALCQANQSQALHHRMGGELMLDRAGLIEARDEHRQPAMHTHEAVA